jgi:hypothetical protein
VRAILLILALADLALKTSPYLSTYSNTVADLDVFDLVADFDGLMERLCQSEVLPNKMVYLYLSNDLMSDA